MSVRWTDWYIANEYDSDDQFVQKLIPFYQACRAQTDGYKEAWDVVQKHGLKPTLKQLVKTRKYPKRQALAVVRQTITDYNFMQ